MEPKVRPFGKLAEKAKGEKGIEKEKEKEVKDSSKYLGRDKHKEAKGEKGIEKEKEEKESKYNLWRPFNNSSMQFRYQRTNSLDRIDPGSGAREGVQQHHGPSRISFVASKRERKKALQEEEEMAALKSRVEEIYFWQFNQTYPKQKGEKFVTVHIDDSVGLCLEVSRCGALFFFLASSSSSSFWFV
jgi:hypothetical protein